ncbi:MAG: histidine kinase [Rubrivivax sp.]|nr:MAG: histidine kinase [Rubrivivax sp.]
MNQRLPDDLQAELQAKTTELEDLRAELEETNRGVLALYAELDLQAEELRRATELKSQFLAYMSHEFRTPIGSIQSIARLLIDRVDGPLTSEQEVQVKFIQNTAAEFSEMVNDLLDLAKVEAGRVDISPAWFELVDLFSALRGMFKPVLTNSEVTLIFEEPRDVPTLFNDDRKLAQILRNFISNALKFTTKGEVRVSANRNGDGSVTFAVADTGIGISPAFHQAIFQDFTQVDSPIQKRLRGTGLGLSLSKRLAELLGGTVGLQSELGSGSTFSVNLPARLPDPDGERQPEPAHERH